MTSTSPIPVVFVHGLWLHSTSWTPWIDLFSRHGFAGVAPGWPGEPETVAAARSSPEAVANLSIDDVVAHYERIVRGFSRAPVLIGHSFGGLIVEKLLGMGLGRAAIAIDPAQIKGVLALPLAQLRSALPALVNPLNLTRAVSLTREEFRFGFGNALDSGESDDLHQRWSIPSPARPLFQAAVANFSLHSEAAVNTTLASRGPLLFISGTADHTVPDVSTESSFKQYRHSPAVTELKRFEGRGHSLVIDKGWADVAAACLQWLLEQNIPEADASRPARAGA